MGWLSRGLTGALLGCLLGCGGLSTQGARYLKQSEPYQRQLPQFQQQLKQSSQLPPEQRVKSIQQLLLQVQTQHQQLQQLTPPKSVQAVHAELDTLYTTMEEFLKACLAGTGDLSDPKVKKLAGQWAEHLDKLQIELQKLETGR